MRWILALAFLLYPTLAGAENLSPNSYITPGGGYGDVIRPPTKYIDPPFASMVKIDIEYGPQPQVTRICSEAAGKFEDIACAWVRPGNCRILIANNLSPELTKAMLIHEKGHCFGWAGDHPPY
jgi:hypothetical protein